MQLLKAARAGSSQEEVPLEAVAYNWHEPHCFSGTELAKLNDFVKRLSAVLADKFSTSCRGQFEIADASMTQHFAGEFARPASDSPAKDYYLAFGADAEHLCGLLGLPEETAITWARQLLGDVEPEKGSGKTLSQLEESLLLDLSSALIEVFCRSCEGAASHPAGGFAKGLWPLEFPQIEELCRISFNVRKAGSAEASGAYLLTTCQMLKSVAGSGAQTAAQFSANEISRAILNHLQTMPVTVTAQLASTSLTFGEVMNLRVDDIVLLDKRVNEPGELMIDGRTIYCGWPAKAEGKYALIVAPPALEETT